ncbi:MAG TPA: hypothetical protein VJ672_12290 [Gemmatimonadaceae bacterium]|nr:hypothetical protein [Gemmatimonadaceae bacterium]
MSGKFRATGSFYQENRHLLVVHGELVDGVAHIGQYVSAPENFSARVHDVEVVRLADGHEDLALTFAPASAEQAAAWQRRRFDDELLELAETPRTAPPTS